MAPKAIIDAAAFLLGFLDYAVWLLTLGPLWALRRRREMGSTMMDKWSQITRVAHINGGLDPSGIWHSTAAIGQGYTFLSTSPFPDEVFTLDQLFQRAYKVYATHPAQGIRPLLRTQRDEGYRFPAKVFGETQWRTYAELGEVAHAFGAGLRAIGLKPQPEGKFDDLEGNFKVMMYADTCAEWMICAQGAFLQSMVVATCYATLGIDAVAESVQEGKVSALVCNREKVQEILARAKKDMPSLEVVIYTYHGCVPEQCCPIAADPSSAVRVLSVEEVLELGRAKPVPPSPAKPEYVAVLMYTSGSTGKAKGVVVRHSQLLAALGGCAFQFDVLLKENSEVYIAYLPLGHIMEVLAEMYFYGKGNRIGYADPKTLLSGPERCYPVGALEEFRPTLMAGVPKVWETIKKGAEAKMNKKGEAVTLFFKAAMQLRSAALAADRYTPVFDLMMFSRLKNMIGGSMKFTLSGGGAISPDVQEWVRTAFGVPLTQGYGLTETCGALTIQHPFDQNLGVAGCPVASLEIALHSEPEITDSNGLPYLTTDRKHANGSQCQGRGEIWVRGPSVASGYYKMPEATAEAFDADGWFHTGDIGMMTLAGQLKVIDRKKNLVKLKGGEYVALEMMNVTYNNADIINTEGGGVCSYADDMLDKPVCLAQCNVQTLTALAADVGVTGKDGEELCRDPKVMSAVKAKLDAVAKAGHLPALMHIAAVMPVVVPWTPDNGCLTATNKLVSKQIWKKHDADLELLKPAGTR